MAKRIYFLFLILVFLTACSKNEENSSENKKEESKEESLDINGIVYFENELYTATNKGLNVYRNETWENVTGESIQYSAIQSVTNGLMISGTKEKKPLGITTLQISDLTTKPVAFDQMASFHFMASDLTGSHLYILQDAMNEETLKYGLHYSQDGGKTWNQSKLEGLNSNSMGMISVHPSNGHIMAMATQDGVFLSNDYGNTFAQIISNEMVTAISMGKNEIYYSTVNEREEKVYLKKFEFATNRVEVLNIPHLDFYNPITYIAVNVENPSELSFSTYQDDIYHSNDTGSNWNQLLFQGDF